MKKLMLIALTFLLFASCKHSKIDIPSNADLPFKNYISAYTSGMVSITSPIRVVFKDSLPLNMQEDKELLRKHIETTPSFKYDIEVINAKTITIKPLSNLESGVRYQVAFNVEDIVNEELEVATFPVVFETYIQDFTLNALELTPQNINAPNTLILTGKISTDDVAELSVVKKIVTKIGDFDLQNVTWQKEGSRSFVFKLKNIVKKEANYTIPVVLNGNSIGMDREYKTFVQVAAIAEFKLSKWKYESYPDQTLALTFSEPLNESQNLEGFIEIEHIKKFTYSIQGSIVNLFLNNNYTGTTKLTIHSGIKNHRGKNSKNKQVFDIVIDDPLPTVELIGEGTILPNSQGLIIPFKTIGLKKVDIDIFKIYEKNILQFLQVNSISERDELRRVGEKIKSKTINLETKNKNKLKQWTTHGLNLRDIIDPEPGAIYRVRFSFSQAYTFCECEEENTASYYSEYYDYYENRSYDRRKDFEPCENYFYYYSTKSKNLLASNLGLVLKKAANNNYTVISTNLIHGKEEPKVVLNFYNFQQKRIKSVTTNEKGFASIQLKEEPYVVVGKKGRNKAYLKLNGGYANSLSKFDTEGVTRTDGVDAFFYGERGVWRPGDNIHLSFIIRDEMNSLHEGLPMKIILSDPQGQIVNTTKLDLTTKGIHTVNLKTDADAPTGNYSVKLIAGSHTFYHSLKVETIRPNRLKIHIKPEQEEIQGATAQNINLSSAWLHGAIAANLEANVTMVLSPIHTSFNAFKNYSFEDITKSYAQNDRVIFQDTLNRLGERVINLSPYHIKSKGKLRASFVTKVFEKGGGFSIDQMSTIYHPYSTYVGMKLPLNRYGSLPTRTDNKIEVVCVNTKGEINTKQDTLQVKVYKLEWRWWWRHNNEDIASFINNNSYNLVQDQTIVTNNGKSSFTFRADEYDWGQYYMQVALPNGHTTGQTIYVDYPGRNRNQQEQNNAMLLNMKANKDRFETGETAVVSFPSPGEGRALVSIENDVEVVKTFWVDTKKGNSTFSLKVDKSMAPNCYVNLTVLQKHIHDKNDLPLRMYGVIPITVFDKNTVLNPVITMKEEIRPEEFNTISVHEKAGRGMHYTLAVVDDGLLDLTRFSTPQVWQYFNKKRSLGVSSYDVYDDVINSFSGKFDNVYAVGGDGAAKGGNTAKANRFKPVVKFLGPFYLKPGEKANHKIKISNYVGSVRAMVVCRSGNAFGKTDHTSRVKKPLMIQSNAPRVLTPNDEIAFPVTVFATEKVKFPITITYSNDKLLKLETQKITINEVKNGEIAVFFKAKVNSILGVTKLTFTASCANDKHTETIEIPVRMPGYEIDEVQDTMLLKGQSTTLNFKQLGWENTNSAVLEVSQFPSINLDKRLRYLIQYPHGCIEQTTSSVFPQLFLAQLTELSPERENRIEQNIEHGIKRIQKFMTMSGGFAYWPGDNTPSEWGSNYAGHFLLEAKAKGYYVPDHLLTKWYEYQKERANAYSKNSSNSYYMYQNELVQAYRLFTLALYGQAEIGAMNRFKENGISSNTSKWRLASAYALAGQHEVAKSIVQSISYEVKSYRDDYYSYGSNIRDEAIIVESMNYIQNHYQLHKAMKRLANNLGSNRWMSTQETAYALCAFSKVVDKAKNSKASYTYTENGLAKNSVAFDDVISQSNISQVNKTNTVVITNSGSNPLYIRLINTGTPSSTTLSDASNGLKMSVNYFDAEGKRVNSDSLEFGKDYKVQVSLKNTDTKVKVNNLALSTFLPAGCEIQNDRMFETGESNSADYEDIKDDKIYTYFGLSPLQTRSFTYQFTASFKGKYVHPGVHCEAMYDAATYALVKGKMIVVY